MDMRIASDLFEQPVERAARVVALALLDDTEKARERLGDARDLDALHDFRVALRRLRSWLRAFRPWLEESVPKKARRRLREAARVTGRSRDAEVQLKWLHAQRRGLSSRQRMGLAWFIERIEQAKTRADADVVAAAARAFDRARRVLEETLREYRTTVDGAGDEGSHAFGPVLAMRLRDHAAALERRLAKVHTFDDEKKAHAARVATKRLRYLLEPAVDHARGAANEGASLVADLSALQDAFGDWHDVHIFASAIVKASEKAAAEAVRHRLFEASLEGDPTPEAARAARDRDVTLGLLALAGRLRARGESAFGEVERRWIGAGESFVARTDVVATGIEDYGGGSDEDVASIAPMRADASSDVIVRPLVHVSP